MKDKNTNYGEPTEELVSGFDGRYAPGYTDATPGINTPGIELPAFNPPVPNRAWTAMVKEENTTKTSEKKKRH